MILNLDEGTVLGHDLAEGLPSPERILKSLTNAMKKPMPGTGEPRRPAKVLFAEPALTEALASQLDAMGVGTETRELPMLGEIVEHMEHAMRNGEPELEGLLEGEGVTPEIVGGFFAAAADFYRAEPWVKLFNEQAILVRFPAQGGVERIAVVMGNGGVEYGVALYDNWEQVEKLMVGVEHPMEAIPEQGALTMFYEPVDGIPFDDYEAQQEHGWEVADEESYPAPFRFLPDDTLRPTLEELTWLEAALRALPEFAERHLKPNRKGDYAPVETTLQVTTHTGEVEVFLKYPAGKLDHTRKVARLPNWPSPEAEGDEDEWLDFDPRAMEGEMAQMLSAMFGGEMPANKLRHLGNTKLDKAQALMYQAWEEEKPAKRIALARKALATSPDCADAYVLLAEEEAENLADAMKLYQQGIEAGERALGKKFFKENVGYFWGMLEARPYMRARFGLANCLWDARQFEEAIGHYQDMLRLNPNDNQGVRYSLANLLLEIDRDSDLIKLLKQYKDDAMAAWLYTWALVEFRKSGISKTADKRLREALKQNPYVPSYLTGKKRIPNRLPDMMGWGDDDEAVHYASAHLNHWRRTNGALEWLKQSWGK